MTEWMNERKYAGEKKKKKPPNKENPNNPIFSAGLQALRKSNVEPNVARISTLSELISS